MQLKSYHLTWRSITNKIPKWDCTKSGYKCSTLCTLMFTVTFKVFWTDSFHSKSWVLWKCDCGLFGPKQRVNFIPIFQRFLFQNWVRFLRQGFESYWQKFIKSTPHWQRCLQLLFPTLKWSTNHSFLWQQSWLGVEKPCSLLERVLEH